MINLQTVVYSNEQGLHCLVQSTRKTVAHVSHVHVPAVCGKNATHVTDWMSTLDLELETCFESVSQPP